MSMPFVPTGILISGPPLPRTSISSTSKPPSSSSCILDPIDMSYDSRLILGSILVKPPPCQSSPPPLLLLAPSPLRPPPTQYDPYQRICIVVLVPFLASPNPNGNCFNGKHKILHACTNSSVLSQTLTHTGTAILVISLIINSKKRQ